MSTGRCLAGAVVAFAALVGRPAAAQAVDAQLAQRAAHEVFSAVDLGQLIRKAAAEDGAFVGRLAKIRPQWPSLLTEALGEVSREDQPAFEAVLGRAFQKTYTDEELRAAVTVFEDPEARAIIATMSRGAPPPVGAKCASACMRAMSSAAGQRFVSKLNGVFDAETQQDLNAVLLPDLLIRFGEKAKAAEAKAGRAGAVAAP